MLPPLTLAAPGWAIGLLAFGFVFVSLFMMLVILIQKPKGGGLSGAFGGAGAGNAQAAFGAKVGDVLTWLTVSCFVLFLVLAMGLTWAINPSVAAHKQSAATTPLSQTTGEAGAGMAAGDTPDAADAEAAVTEAAKTGEAVAETAEAVVEEVTETAEAASPEAPATPDASETPEAPASPEAPAAPAE